MRSVLSALALAAAMSACTNSGLSTSAWSEQPELLSPDLEVEATSPLSDPAPQARSTAPVYPFHLGDWSDQPVAPELGLHGSGTIVADLDGDDLLDVVLVGSDATTTSLFLQRPEGWVDATSRVPVEVIEAGIGGSAVDYDGDGDQDLLITSWVQNRLLVNDGDATFTDHTEAAGLLSDARHTVSASWGDVDADGDLDLLLGTFGPEPVGDEAPAADASWLYRNAGDGTFDDVSHLLPLDVHRGRLFNTALVDMDFDGLPDLLSIADAGGAPTGLYWNIGGLWVRDRKFASPRAGMGLGIGDVNGDGVFDLAQSSYEAISLLESLDAYWIDKAQAAGLAPDVDAAGQEIGWGTEIADLDNDADLDVFITFGAWDAMPGAAAQHDGLYLREEGRFTDVAPSWGVDAPEAGRGLVLADLDRDGWLDIVRRYVGAPASVHLQNPGAESWVVVSLQQPGRNPDAVGATVVAEVDGVRQVRSILAGSTGMFSGGPAEAHFGLGGAEQVDRLEITWPDGSVDVVEDLAARRFIEVRRL